LFICPQTSQEAFRTLPQDCCDGRKICKECGAAGLIRLHNTGFMAKGPISWLEVHGRPYFLAGELQRWSTPFSWPKGCRVTPLSWLVYLKFVFGLKTKFLFHNTDFMAKGAHFAAQSPQTRLHFVGVPLTRVKKGEIACYHVTYAP